MSDNGCFLGNTTKVPSFNLQTLIPEHKTYYRYKGSLTTPACQESVIWTVFNDPIYVNENEVKLFQSLMQFSFVFIERCP